jgi:hypothetical protein
MNRPWPSSLNTDYNLKEELSIQIRLYGKNIIIVHFLVLSHMFGYVEQKLLGRSQQSLVFLKSNLFGSEK